MKKIIIPIISITFVGLFITGISCSTNTHKEVHENATEKIISDINTYQKEVELIRGKQFKSTIPTAVQSMSDFRNFVKNDLDKELPPAKAQITQMAMIKLGLLPEGYDLRKGFENLLLTQAGAYYDPRTKSIYLLKVDAFPPEQLKSNLIHELCHALQDQSFNLADMNKNASASEDSATAIRYLYEGEATYVMTMYSLKPMMGGQEISANNPVIAQIFSRMKFMTRDMLLNQAESQMLPLAEKYPEMKTALEGLKSAPIHLFWYLNAPYIHGLSSISDMLVYDIPKQDKNYQGGWQNIDIAYQKPPVSTEQIMHPRKLLIERDEPTVINQPALPPQIEISFSDVLGEFGFWTLFSTFEIPSLREAAEGWDGDKYFLLKNIKTNKYSLYLSTVWDSNADATESFKAYQSVIEKKYSGWQKDKNSTKTSITWISPNGKSTVFISIENTKWISIEDVPSDELELWKNLLKKN
ncbi:MAG: hypothetical protein WC980_00965 [Candidatus Brocadiia bacterium]